MKQGKSLEEMATEVARISETKRDLLVDTRHLMMTSEFAGTAQAYRSMLTVVGLDGEEFGVNEYAHGQIAEYAKVPLPFYRRLRSDYPDVLDLTVNRILHTEASERMIRTIDGRARAFLSSKYRRRDNYDLLEAVMPPLTEILGGGLGAHVPSCNLTETKLYLTVVFPMWQAEVKVGDPVKLGVRISNSEVGAGATTVETILWRLSCLNGMVTSHSLRSAHVGRKQTAEEDFSIYSDATLALDDAAFFAKVTDAIRACADEARFESIVSEMRAKAETKIEADPPKAVEILGNRVGLSEEEKAGVLRHLIEGADLSEWGYLNSVTRMAQDVESYDRSMSLEAVGGRLAAENLAEILSA